MELAAQVRTDYRSSSDNLELRESSRHGDGATYKTCFSVPSLKPSGNMDQEVINQTRNRRKHAARGRVTGHPPDGDFTELLMFNIGCGQQLNEIAVSDRGTLRGLTQFPRRSVSARPQIAEYKSHRGTVRFEGGFCATLFQTARKSLILNGEMSEWSIEHAWKA